MFNNNPDDPHRYDDMLDLPHHVSPNRRRMTQAERAAQFAPFAALTGYGDAIDEAARLTMRQVELGEAEREELDRKLRVVKDKLDGRPVLSVTYFVPDPRKAGGRYDVYAGAARRIVPETYSLEFEGGRVIDIDDIIDIEGELFNGLTF